jgi:hypothetical protein
MRTVDSIGIVLERTDARPLGAPGSARAAARVAHHPPVVARGPMALALRLPCTMNFYVIIMLACKRAAAVECSACVLPTFGPLALGQLWPIQ